MKKPVRLSTPLFSLAPWLCTLGGSMLLVAMVACSDDGSGGPVEEKGGTGGTASAGAPGAGTGGTAGTTGGTGGSTTAGSAGSSAGKGGSAGGGAGVAGTGGNAGSGGGVPAGCTPIELKAFFYDSKNSSDVATIVRAPLSTSLGNAQTIDGLSLSILSPDGSVLTETGSFTLGQGDESNYSTCRHCVVVDQDAGSAASRKFFPTSGVLTIDPSTPPINASTKGLKGSLKGVELHEVTIAAPDYVSTPVAGGGCLYIVDAPVAVTP